MGVSLTLFSILVWTTLLQSGGAATRSEWREGRATYFGERHDGRNDGFSIHRGSCMFGDLDPKIGTGWDVAAFPDMHEDKCYELACSPMDFHDNYGEKIERMDACKDPEKTVIVTVVDTCECEYAPNAWSNKRWCCGDMDHLDISVFAFEKLADLSIGVIGLKYRPVPCPGYSDPFPVLTPQPISKFTDIMSPLNTGSAVVPVQVDSEQDPDETVGVGKSVIAKIEARVSRKSAGDVTETTTTIVNGKYGSLKNTKIGPVVGVQDIDAKYAVSSGSTAQSTVAVGSTAQSTVAVGSTAQSTVVVGSTAQSTVAVGGTDRVEDEGDFLGVLSNVTVSEYSSAVKVSTKNLTEMGEGIEPVGSTGVVNEGSKLRSETKYTRVSRKSAGDRTDTTNINNGAFFGGQVGDIDVGRSMDVQKSDQKRAKVSVTSVRHSDETEAAEKLPEELNDGVSESVLRVKSGEVKTTRVSRKSAGDRMMTNVIVDGPFFGGNENNDMDSDRNVVSEDAGIEFADSVGLGASVRQSDEKKEAAEKLLDEQQKDRKSVSGSQTQHVIGKQTRLSSESTEDQAVRNIARNGESTAGVVKTVSSEQTAVDTVKQPRSKSSGMSVGDANGLDVINEMDQIESSLVINGGPSKNIRVSRKSSDDVTFTLTSTSTSQDSDETVNGVGSGPVRPEASENL